MVMISIPFGVLKVRCGGAAKGFAIADRDCLLLLDAGERRRFPRPLGRPPAGDFGMVCEHTVCNGGDYRVVPYAAVDLIRFQMIWMGKSWRKTSTPS